jgi:hypothetical protein
VRLAGKCARCTARLRKLFLAYRVSYIAAWADSSLMLACICAKFGRVMYFLATGALAVHLNGGSMAAFAAPPQG